MTRKDFIAAIIRQIDPFVECNSINDITKTVLGFKQKHNLFLSQCTPIVKDGFLYINDMAVKRIAAKTKQVSYNEKAYCYEGRILAQNGL